MGTEQRNLLEGSPMGQDTSTLQNTAVYLALSHASLLDTNSG